MTAARRGRTPARRFARLRERWRNASLKTSFMAYTLGFLVAALVLSITTASVFADLQNQVTSDAYEYSGLYLYDEDSQQLVPARLVEISAGGSTAFVQTVREGVTSVASGDLPISTGVMDASDYLFSEYSTLEEEEGLTLEFGSGTLDSSQPEVLDLSTLPAYDAWAREQFALWLAEHPNSPYAAFFSTDGASSSESADTAGLLTSAVGYYLSTPPSAGASALSTVFGLLTFLMFPLWFGLCIFAAARRFFRTRLEPGISTLDEAAGNIANQNLDFAVHPVRDDELGRLADSFETMRASLAESQRTLWRTAEERKRLNAAFAHDLRTPLTILKGKIELLDAHVRAGDVSPEQLVASVSSLADQANRLERYVEAMSGLQKLEDRVPVVHVVAFDDTARMIEDIGSTLAVHAEPSFALSISSQCDKERPELSIDGSLVGEVAENLIGNALRYAHMQVDARMDVEGGSLVIVVEDDGPGFSPEALERGCAPFFSESPSREHFGLGLNIASLLCEKHGGRLSLENRAAGGARTIARFSLDFDGVESR